MSARAKAAPTSVVEPTVPLPQVGRLAYRFKELAEMLGVSVRTLERQRSAGRFPKPDLHIGKAPLWKPETINRWIEGGGR